MEREQRRTLLFWSREAFLIVMERAAGSAALPSAAPAQAGKRVA